MSSLLDVLQRLEAADPARGLFLHEDFARPPTHLPYAELPSRVAACAGHFRARGLKAGDRVLLPFETSEQTLLSFFGLMEVGALPLSVKPFVLGTPREAYLAFLGRVAERYGVTHVLDVPSLAGLPLSLERLPLPPPGARLPGARLRSAAPEDLAFVQFSSGSTSFPKGVPITHGHLLGNVRLIAEQDGRDAGTRGSSWLPLYHDMGLIGLLSCVLMGCDVYQTQPVAFLMDPLGWWEFMSERRIHLAVIPNFAIDYSLKQLREVDAEDLGRLDLGALGMVYLGSEPINIANLEAFLALLGPRGLKRSAFKPCYGMAEAVLMVSCTGREESFRVVTAPNGQPAISVGRPLPAFQVRLCTEDGRTCGEGELGEVQLSGGTLADAYFEDARPLRGPDGFYATGDVGFLQGGELFITGRIGDRIKVNGQSFFSSDFEQAVERVPFVRAGRTAVIQAESGRVVVLAEVSRPAVLRTLRQSQQQVCEAVLQGVGVTLAAEDVLFIRYGQLPKTSSGKLQRRAVAEAWARGHIRVATPGALRADVLRMRTQRLVQGSLLVAQQQARALAQRLTRRRS